ncbi:transcriptional regulator marr-type conserved site [Desulfoluna spongiiphila]|nr:transcriptional regulator marr-type conserved site [Desulfoluna spongiiphila]
MNMSDSHFVYKLSVIRKLAFSFLEEEMARAGVKDLPPSFGDILYIVHTKGPVAVKDIAAHSYKDKSTVSTIIHQLEKKGYVQKEPDPDDGRKVRVTLTETAATHMESMARISAGLKEKLFQDMSREERDILFLLMDKIERNLKRS